MAKPKTEKNPKGAGRKLQFGEPTDTVTFRCPISKIPELTKIGNDKLDEWRLKQIKKVITAEINRLDAKNKGK